MPELEHHDVNEDNSSVGDPHALRSSSTTARARARTHAAAAAPTAAAAAAARGHRLVVRRGRRGLLSASGGHLPS